MIEPRTEEYQDLAKNLLGVDRKIVLGMRRTLRAEAKPLGEEIVTAIGEAMPHKGGLSNRVLTEGRVSLLVDLQRGVRVSIANRKGMYMAAFESGTIRHPTFGHGPWKSQTVPAGKGRAAFDAGSAALTGRVIDTVAATIQKEL